MPSDNFSKGRAAYLKSSTRNLNEQDALQLGELIGIAMTFGITDLHRDNVLILADRLQVVDLECLFWDSKLPSESMLLFGRETDPSKTLIPRFTSKPNAPLPLPFVLKILTGLIRSMEFFLLASESLRSVFKTLMIEAQSQPIRILLRKTRQYRDALEDPKLLIAGLLKEESVQLERRDIPYFFGYLGSKSIHYYAAPDEIRALETIEDITEAKLTRAFVCPSKIFLHERLLQTYKYAMLEIVHRLVSTPELVFKNDEFTIEKQQGSVRIGTQRFSIQSKPTQ